MKKMIMALTVFTLFSCEDKDKEEKIDLSGKYMDSYGYNYLHVGSDFVEWAWVYEDLGCMEVDIVDTDSDPEFYLTIEEDKYIIWEIEATGRDAKNVGELSRYKDDGLKLSHNFDVEYYIAYSGAFPPNLGLEECDW